MLWLIDVLAKAILYCFAAAAFSLHANTNHVFDYQRLPPLKWRISHFHAKPLKYLSITA